MYCIVVVFFNDSQVPSIGSNISENGIVTLLTDAAYWLLPTMSLLARLHPLMECFLRISAVKNTAKTATNEMVSPLPECNKMVIN